MSTFTDACLESFSSNPDCGDGLFGMSFGMRPTLCYCRDCGHIETISDECPHAPHCSRCGAPMFTARDVRLPARRKFLRAKHCPGCGCALNRGMVKCRACFAPTPAPKTFDEEPTDELKLQFRKRERKQYRQIIAGGRGTFTQGNSVPHRKTRVHGEKVKNAKLNDRLVRLIRQKYDNGERGIDIAAEFGISKAQVCRIGNRLNWSRIQ